MTPVEVKAQVKPESLTTAFSSTETVTGIVYFSCGSIAFPEDVWDDFPVIIVGWWLNNLAEYLSGDDGRSVELGFMDGPFYVLLSLGSNMGSSIRAEMIRDQFSDCDQVLHTAMTDVRTLYRSIDEVAGTLIEFCNRQPTAVKDYSDLVEARQRALDAFLYRFGPK